MMYRFIMAKSISDVNIACYKVAVSILEILIKGSIFLKNRHFIIQKRFNKLIYDINTITKYGT